MEITSRYLDKKRLIVFNLQAEKHQQQPQDRCMQANCMYFIYFNGATY